MRFFAIVVSLKADGFSLLGDPPVYHTVLLEQKQGNFMPKRCGTPQNVSSAGVAVYSKYYCQGSVAEEGPPQQNGGVDRCTPL